MRKQKEVQKPRKAAHYWCVECTKRLEYINDGVISCVNPSCGKCWPALKTAP